MTWIRGHWRYLLVGFVTFSIGAVAGGGGKPNTTVTRTTTVAGPTRYKTRPAAARTIVKTRTVTTAAPAPKPASPPPAPASMSFSGNGGKKIGTINVPRDSTFKWTNDGQLFQTFDDNEGIGVNSQGHSGSSDLPAGSYTGVQINADGNWTVSIVPK